VVVRAPRVVASHNLQRENKELSFAPARPRPVDGSDDINPAQPPPTETRRLGREDEFAQALAEEVLRAGADFDGTERSSMRNAEARVTPGVAAAREGDLE
jgi:hypothetical protein